MLGKTGGGRCAADNRLPPRNVSALNAGVIARFSDFGRRKRANLTRDVCARLTHIAVRWHDGIVRTLDVGGLRGGGLVVDGRQFV